MATLDEMNTPGDDFYADMVRKVVNVAINNYPTWSEEQRQSCAGSVANHLSRIRDYKAYARALVFIIQCPDLYRDCERRQWQ